MFRNRNFETTESGTQYVGILNEFIDKRIQWLHYPVNDVEPDIYVISVKWISTGYGTPNSRKMS